MPGSPHSVQPLALEHPTTPALRDAAALAALTADIAADCATRLARVTGSYGLLLAGMPLRPPPNASVACWAVLTPRADAPGWQGGLRADAVTLPFADGAFGAILACFSGDAGLVCADELARVLAPHGTLLVADLHPRSLWRAGVAPERWERALRRAGLDVRPAARRGAPWRRARGSDGLPRWLTRVAGGAWIIEARPSVLAALPLRQPAARRALEHNALLPGARRECA